MDDVQMTNGRRANGSRFGLGGIVLAGGGEHVRGETVHE